MFAVAVTFAPAIGPTIGGYLTENYGWQTIFFVNTPPSIVMVVALALTLERQPLQLRLLKEGDWVGILTMAIGLAVAADGARRRQQGRLVRVAFDPATWRLSPSSFSSAFIAIELTVKKPLVNLRLLKRRNFSIGVLANMLSASRCSARSISCRNISARFSATTPSRSAMCWRGRDCRNCCDPLRAAADEALRRALYRLRRHRRSSPPAPS